MEINYLRLRAYCWSRSDSDHSLNDLIGSPEEEYTVLVYDNATNIIHVIKQRLHHA